MKNLQEAVNYWNAKQEERKPLAATDCVSLRQPPCNYIPGAVIRFYGHDAEIVSSPFPSKYGASIEVRAPHGSPAIITAAMPEAAIRQAIRVKPLLSFTADN